MKPELARLAALGLVVGGMWLAFGDMAGGITAVVVGVATLYVDFRSHDGET